MRTKSHDRNSTQQASIAGRYHWLLMVGSGSISISRILVTAGKLVVVTLISGPRNEVLMVTTLVDQYQLNTPYSISCVPTMEFLGGLTVCANNCSRLSQLYLIFAPGLFRSKQAPPRSYWIMSISYGSYLKGKEKIPSICLL
jgi:hypothetical protein